MRNYTLLNGTGYNITVGQSIALIGVNGLSSGSSVIFEIYYQSGVHLKASFFVVMSVLILI